MPYAAIEHALSINRFSTYRQAVIRSIGKSCNTTTLKLYEWNAELSSRFFFPIHITKSPYAMLSLMPLAFVMAATGQPTPSFKTLSII